MRAYAFLKDGRPSLKADPVELFDLQEIRKGSRRLQYAFTAGSVLKDLFTTTLPRPFLFPGERERDESIKRDEVVNCITVENELNRGSFRFIAYNSNRFGQ